MTGLAAVDSVDVQILVDNVTDSLSSVPAFVETELGGLARRRGAAWVLGGACLCCAAHGLSCLLTLRRGDSVHTVLFDSGPEDRTFAEEFPGPELGDHFALLGHLCRAALDDEEEVAGATFRAQVLSNVDLTLLELGGNHRELVGRESFEERHGMQATGIDGHGRS